MPLRKKFTKRTVTASKRRRRIRFQNIRIKDKDSVTEKM